MTTRKNHRIQIDSQVDEIAFVWENGVPTELIPYLGQQVTGRITLEAGVGGEVRFTISHEPLATHPRHPAANVTPTAEVAPEQ